MSRLPKFVTLALVLLGALQAAADAGADAEPATGTPAPAAEAPPLGGTFQVNPDHAGPQLAVGCRNHRALMFVVSQAEGEDPVAGKLVAERDCRPLLPKADDNRCGPGGLAFPATGPRQTYSSYCRENSPDFRLHILDSLMLAASASK